MPTNRVTGALRLTEAASSSALGIQDSFLGSKRQGGQRLARTERSRKGAARLGGAVTLSPLANPFIRHFDESVEAFVGFLAGFFEAFVLCAVLLFGALELFFMAPLGFRYLSDDVRDLDQVFR